MINEKEIARLRVIQDDGGLSDGQVYALLDEVGRLCGEVASMTSEMLDCRASWAIACETLSKAERERDEARSACAAMRTACEAAFVAMGGLDFTDDAAAAWGGLHDALTTDAGRPILDALKQAEEALREVFNHHDPDVRETVQAALAALEGLRR